MLLLIDIGNTSITIGFYEERIRNIVRFDTVLEKRKLNGYFPAIRRFILRNRMKKPEGAAMSSVVPQITPIVSEALKKSFGFKPLHVSYQLRTGIKFCIKNPGELGADRIADAVAAHKLYKGHLIVIDFGTATTINVISVRGEYKGGVIMPGLGMSAKALIEKTAKLPNIELRAPVKIIGNDTESNMLSGIIIGHAGAVERIIRDIKHVIKKSRHSACINVIATGGFANLVVPYIKGIKEINPLLTLEGLRIIYDLN